MTFIWIVSILAALGLLCLLCALSGGNMPSDVTVGEISADNAEYKLKKALAATKKAGGVIYAVCLDDEAVKICEILQRENPRIIWQRKTVP